MTQHLVTRKEWGAQYEDGFRDRPVPISEWWLHHSVTVAPDLLPPFTDDDAAVRTLERIGESRFGGGISYTFPVTPVGRIYVGHSLPRQGAHTKGHNTVGAAFVLVGDYTKRAPTDAQRDRIAERMVIEHRAGRAKTHRLNGGHRDVSATSCPGDQGYAALADINARADRLWKAGYPTPAVPEEDDMPSAEEIAAAVWEHKVPRPGNTDSAAGLQLGNANVNAYRAAGTLGALEATVAAQAAALALLANGTPVDIEQIRTAIREAVSDFELTLAPKKEETS